MLRVHFSKASVLLVFYAKGKASKWEDKSLAGNYD